jgi:hypothetical protein
MAEKSSDSDRVDAQSRAHSADRMLDRPRDNRADRFRRGLPCRVPEGEGPQLTFPEIRFSAHAIIIALEQVSQCKELTRAFRFVFK